MVQEANPDDMEQRILDAAHDLFVHYGYDKTTMNDIADAAGVSKSTIYLRWNKKDALFDALFLREGHRYTEEWFKRIETDPQGGTYGAWMRHALQAFWDNPLLKAVYSKNRRMLGSILQRLGIEQIYLRRMQMAQAFFKQMQAAQLARQDIDPKTLAYLLNTLHFGLIHMSELIPDEHAPPIDEALGMMVAMIDRFVTPEGGGDSAAGKRILREFMSEIRQIFDELEQQA